MRDTACIAGLGFSNVVSPFAFAGKELTAERKKKNRNHHVKRRRAKRRRNNAKRQRRTPSVRALPQELQGDEIAKVALRQAAWPGRKFRAGPIHPKVAKEALQTLRQISGQSLVAQAFLPGRQNQKEKGGRRSRNDKWGKRTPDSDQGVVGAINVWRPKPGGRGDCCCCWCCRRRLSFPE